MMRERKGGSVRKGKVGQREKGGLDIYIGVLAGHKH